MMAECEVAAVVVVSEEVDDLFLGINWFGRQHCRWSFTQNLIDIYRKILRLISRSRQYMMRRI